MPLENSEQERARVRATALIPARGGSKGIPLKNLAPLAGRPLIAWTVAAALASPSVHRVLVSTDDERIAAESRALGAEVPYLRPAALARDDTPTLPVVIDVIEWLAREGALPEWLLLLQPTSPLRTDEDIEAALTLAGPEVDSVVSVVRAKTHPHLVMRMDAHGRLSDFVPHPPVVRRQDLEPAFALNGAIYLSRVSTIRASSSLLGGRLVGYLMPAERSIDIDEAGDILLAESLLKARGHV